MVPGGELVKIVLGSADAPQTLEAYLELAVNTALDFIPGGKVLKVFKGTASRLGIKKLEEQLLKQVRKRVGRLNKAAKGIGESINQLNNLVQKGKAPKSITRFDRGRLANEKIHVHFKDGSTLNIDGTWKHGSKILTGKEIKFLKENDWRIP